jgi:hypothetical protein
MVSQSARWQIFAGEILLLPLLLSYHSSDNDFSRPACQFTMRYLLRTDLAVGYWLDSAHARRLDLVWIQVQIGSQHTERGSSGVIAHPGLL